MESFLDFSSAHLVDRDILPGGDLLGLLSHPSSVAARRVRFRPCLAGDRFLSDDWTSAQFTIEPAGEVKAGAGHLHIIVDAACVAAGQIVPADDSHLHYGKAQTEATLELTPGTHTLCLQAADGVHTALASEGATQVVTITVR